MKQRLPAIVLAALCLNFPVKAQQPGQPTSTKSTTTGKVISASNQEPLPGAIIKITNTNDQTRSNQTLITNDRGEFTINLPDGTYTLSVHYLSYKTKTLTIQIPLQSPLVITLDTEEQTLQEVEINAGYYTVKDRERTGSISRISAETIEKQPVNNILQSIQGRMTGVDVVQNTGVPGGGFTIQIRGKNSIKQGNDPFYIIDGVPFTATSLASSNATLIAPNSSPLININPPDIESIEVLKDADATAVYGSRGANGVILITTKKGKAGLATVSANLNYGIGRVARKIDLMNNEQYLQMRNEAYFTNDKLTASSPQYATQYDINGTWNQNRSTDWQTELIGHTASTINMQTTISGGSENLQYLISGTHYKEGTVFPGDKSLARNSTNFNLNYNSNKRKFSASLLANFSQTNSNLFSYDITTYIFLPPNYPRLLDDQGQLNWENNTMYVNPMAEIQRNYDSKNKNLNANASLKYNIVTGLQIKANIGYTTMVNKDYSNVPLTTYLPSRNPGPNNRIANFANGEIETWIVEPIVTWEKQINKGLFNFLIGSTFQQNITDTQNIRGAGYTSDALLKNIGAASTLSVNQRGYSEYHYTALFGRLNYIFNNRYILNATGRRDGSTRFGKENQFANFGAIGAAWIVSEEKFIRENLPFVSFAKIRTSYGITGNDQISDYGYLELWNTYTNTYQAISTISPSGLANPVYAWEVNRKGEVALELGLLQDRLFLSAGFFNNRSSNQLISRQLPGSTGFTGIQDNLAATVNNKGWEFELSSQNISNKIFIWTTSINLTIPKNKLLSYPDLKTSSNAINYEIGYPLTINKTYNTFIDSQTGVYVREDYDENGVFNNNDRYIIKSLGKKYYGGILNSIGAKGLQLDFFFQFVNQSGASHIRTISPGYFNSSDPVVNQYVEVLDRWQIPGDVAKFQKYTTSNSSQLFAYGALTGDRSIEDASFIRLKNVFLSYKFPESLIQRLRMRQARVYVQGQNLLTFTKYKGLEPETQSKNALPSLQVFSVGMSLTF